MCFVYACGARGRDFCLYRSSPVRGRVVLGADAPLAPYLDVVYPCLSDTFVDVRRLRVRGAPRVGSGVLGLAPVEKEVRMRMRMRI
jgi:hypothetical protein